MSDTPSLSYALHGKDKKFSVYSLISMGRILSFSPILSEGGRTLSSLYNWKSTHERTVILISIWTFLYLCLSF